MPALPRAIIPDRRGARGPFAAATIALLAALAVIAIGVPQVVERAGRARQARDVTIAADALLTTLLNAETGQRGFLLTGEDAYLRPYRAAQDAMADALAAIRARRTELRPQDPLRPVLEAMLAASAAKQEELEGTLRAASEAGLAAAVARLRDGTGRMQMDEVRRLVDQTHRMADAVATRSSRAVEQRLTWGGLAVGALLALAFGAGLRGLAIGRAREREVAARTRAIVSTAPLGVAMFDAGLRLLIANQAFAEACGWTDAAPAGRTLPEILPETMAPALSAMARQALAAPGELVQADMDGPGPVQQRQSWHVLARAVADERSGPARSPAVLLVLQDITARRAAEAERQLLIHELNHRVKNVIATVQGIATQSWEGAEGDGELFLEVFGARLRSLARAHGLLTEAGWGNAALADVLRVALAPWTRGAESALTIAGPEGPSPRLASAQVLGLALVLHELATNALKYGALSVPEGRVAVTWRREPEGRVELVWRETGGPPITAPPQREGFGSFLIGRAFGADAEPGEVTRDFAPTGLVATFHFMPQEA